MAKDSADLKEDKFTLIYPTFKPPPQSSFANVSENIDSFIAGTFSSLKPLLKKSKGPGSYRGYQFIDSGDLTETIRTEQWFPRKDKNICIEFFFIKRYHSTDSFSPLWFTEWYTEIIYHVRWTNLTGMYESKTQLRRIIKSVP